MMNTTKTGRSRLAAFATVVRLPNLFTAPPDVVLGAALVAVTGAHFSASTVVGLAVASVLLYAAGTTLNDYFDADEDRRERPERPIPSGDVSHREAAVLGVGLLGSGLVVSFVAAGDAALVVAALLAFAIVLYDGVFKRFVVGPVFMGSARGLNVLLGTTAGDVFPTAIPTWQLAVPVVVFLYIAGVTFMAEAETRRGDRTAVTVGIASVAVAALGIVGLLVVRTPPLLGLGLAVGLLVGFLGWTGRSLSVAYADPTPGTVGPAVGVCVLALVVLDAGFAAIVDPVSAFAVLAFLVPAIGLSRLFDVT
jgi:4-hydroxybenzoate polyprenyltransferase